MKGTDNFRAVKNSKGANFLEKRLSDGRGIRFNQNYTFKGFID